MRGHRDFVAICQQSVRDSRMTAEPAQGHAECRGQFVDSLPSLAQVGEFGARSTSSVHDIGLLVMRFARRTTASACRTR